MLRRVRVALCLCFLASFVLAKNSLAQESRHFTFHYAFTVKNLPDGKRVRVWIPAAQSDAFQDVRIISTKGDPLCRDRNFDQA